VAGRNPRPRSRRRSGGASPCGIIFHGARWSHQSRSTGQSRSSCSRTTARSPKTSSVTAHAEFDHGAFVSSHVNVTRSCTCFKDMPIPTSGRCRRSSELFVQCIGFSRTSPFRMTTPVWSPVARGLHDTILLLSSIKEVTVCPKFSCTVTSTNCSIRRDRQRQRRPRLAPIASSCCCTSSTCCHINIS